MNVNNRKLFANRDARRRLADMGGIVASSPELMGEAQKFQVGGMATPYERAVGQLYTMDRGQLQEAGMPRFAGTAMGYLGSDRVMDMLQTIDPNIGPEEFSQMSPQERRDAGFSSSGMINRQYFDVRNNIMESQFPMQGPEMPEMPAEEPARLSPDNFVNPVDEFPAGAGDPFRLPELELDLERDEEERRRIAETFERQAEEEPPVVLEGPTVAETFEEQAQQDEDGGAVLSTVQDLERDVETSEDPVTTVSNRVIETAGMDPASTAEDRIRQYEEIFTRMFGQDDEAKRRERYMNLAMIGFAIAAGEDPSALKNIADGMLRGTEVGMENQRRQEARMDAARTAAVQAGLQDVRDERAAARAAAAADLKFERDVELATLEAIADAAAAGDISYENTPLPAEYNARLEDALYESYLTLKTEGMDPELRQMSREQIRDLARQEAYERTQRYVSDLEDPSRFAAPSASPAVSSLNLSEEDRGALSPVELRAMGIQ